MTIDKERIKEQIITSLKRAIIATIFYGLIYAFYDFDLVKTKVEDVGFDTMNKVFFAHSEQNLTSPMVILFGIDDLYLGQNNLANEQNATNYGYLFPRDKIAKFIDDLDEFCNNIDPKHTPKVLFIDYDFSFTSAPYGLKTKEDEELLKTLAKDRSYAIVIPKTDYFNIIEQGDNANIQKAIKDKKIIIASTGLLLSSDNNSRRYAAFSKFNDKEYVSADAAIWQIMRNNDLNLTKLHQEFKEKDVISNRIMFKAYKGGFSDNKCSMSQSYWSRFVKYSANCNLYDIDENDFANSAIILGGVSANNSDKFSVAGLASSDSLYGAEMHANAIMTMNYFNGQLKNINVFYGLLIVFVAFLISDFTSNYMFAKNDKFEEEKIYLLDLILSVTILLAVSLYLLLNEATWFNCFVPFALSQAMITFGYIKTKVAMVYGRMRKS